ncbi:hypothetical protein B9G69_011585 [Bdellovibrio sp. SKB1291214]|uniref:hypothetical protein n=1 Tax=Bdellovibrio sp. SKB1291214 TaxID=1732569 RepID=UPI000B518819|nr:hypothetical protein [Bdellovibrio sp. SKB1291214]UYL07688.1 hypothetical protein B9G69_011585 [Bdellovibrio sp. SKB1291214]
MKSLKVFSALFLSSALLTTACTPQDKQIGTPDVMAKIKYPKGTKGKTGGGAYEKGAFKIGAYATSSVIMEKQIEALELVQLALGHADATKSLYTLSEKVTDSEKSLTTFKISSTQEEVNYDNKLGSFKGKMSKGFDVVINGATSAVSISATKIKTTADAVNLKKTFVNVFENSYAANLTVDAQDASKLNLVVEASGNFNAGSDKGFKKDDYSLKMLIVVDAASLNEPTVKVLSSTAVMELGSDKVEVSSAGYSLKVEGRCNELIGSGKIESDKYKNPIAFDASTITVGGNRWKQDLAQCGHRPTVDIGRLLVY